MKYVITLNHDDFIALLHMQRDAAERGDMVYLGGQYICDHTKVIDEPENEGA